MRTLLIPAAVLLLTVPVSSPVATAAPIHLGAKGGVNFANLSFDTDSDELQDSRTGLAVGAFVTIPVNRFLSIQPEVLYMEKGDEQDFSNELVDLGDGVPVLFSGTLGIELANVEVPVLAKLNLSPPGAGISAALFAGPAVGINVTADLVASAEGSNASAAGSVDVSEFVKSVEFGLVFGGGVEFPLGAGGQTVGVEARFNLGLSDLNDDPTDDETINSRTVSVLATVGLI